MERLKRESNEGCKRCGFCRRGRWVFGGLAVFEANESGDGLTPSPLSCAAVSGARGEAFSLTPVASILQHLSITRSYFFLIGADRELRPLDIFGALLAREPHRAGWNSQPMSWRSQRNISSPQRKLWVSEQESKSSPRGAT
jgi:hypothetical protein